MSTEAVDELVRTGGQPFWSNEVGRFARTYALI